jgi:hypothetical protein
MKVIKSMREMKAVKMTDNWDSGQVDFIQFLFANSPYPCRFVVDPTRLRVIYSLFRSAVDCRMYHIHSRTVPATDIAQYQQLLHPNRKFYFRCLIQYWSNSGNATRLSP